MSNMWATSKEQLVRQKFSVLLLEIAIKPKIMLDTFVRYHQIKSQKEVNIG